MEHGLIEKELVKAISFLNEQFAVGAIKVKVVHARSVV